MGRTHRVQDAWNSGTGEDRGPDQAVWRRQVVEQDGRPGRQRTDGSISMSLTNDDQRERRRH
jgi:hypothetical protein